MRATSLLFRSIFLVLVAAYTAMVLPYEAVAGEPTAKTRPNVVLIIIDTLRADVLGAYGGSFAASPELDEIAKDGTVFESVISQASWTRASLASMLTSQYPRSLGVHVERWDRLPSSATTLEEVLQAAGYATIGITGNPHLNHTFNFQQGFGQYLDSSVVFPWMQEEEGKDKMNESVDLAPADQLFTRLAELAQKVNDRPLYMRALIMDVHQHSRLKGEAIAARFRGSPNADYLQGVSIASGAVKRFIDKVRQLPHFENALFVITADHGEGLRDHPAVPHSDRHGNLLYESHLHVPLILYNPSDARLRNKRVRHDAQLLDVMPTILDYAGVEIPKGLQGRSQLPDVLSGNATAPDPFIVSETRWRNVEKLAAYEGKWAYIENRDRWPGVAPKELQARHGPQNGLKTDKGRSQKSVLETFANKLAQWEARFPVHKPEVSAESSDGPLPEEVQQLKSLGYL